MTTDETPETLTVEVEHTDRGWMVVHVVDGERKHIEPPHPDRESADAAAAIHTQASDRWTGAAEVVPPGDRPTDG
ncbi:hypothetical protein [Mycolicibacterium sp.]|uniref:hypothetical protein n=1 Tax=Mycolicibacterium sp. TaxID=2320850 RepID=UPI001A265889|nr:hypothetical protein [Mycolicibacterium sp.]MBJ7337791.1 hypothetical protein [Mycolicibacterium sp.]